MKELLNKSLPKWAVMVVKGKKITEDQAKEILIRTDGFYFSTNNHNFCNKIINLVYNTDLKGSSYNNEYDAIKKKLKTEDHQKVYKYKRKIEKQYKLLDLEYLNNSRIVSCWIGGPHGWCNWNGYIGCNNYNIGKWPSIETVYKEWEIIAKTFSFLELRCQLFSGETCEEENNKPIIEFIVKNGKVSMKEPDEILDYFNDDINIMNIMDSNREIGCSINQLKEALNYVKTKNNHGQNKEYVT